MLISLTIRERLELTNLIHRVCRGKPKDANRIWGRDVLKIIRIPKDDLLLYETEIPGFPGQAARNMRTIEAAEPVDFEISLRDVKFLKRIMDEGATKEGGPWTNLGPDDDDWWMPLDEKITVASETKETQEGLEAEESAERATSIAARRAVRS
jgi:hypothetical protein